MVGKLPMLQLYKTNKFELNIKIKLIIIIKIKIRINGNNEIRQFFFFKMDFVVFVLIQKLITVHTLHINLIVITYYSLSGINNNFYD